MKVLILGAGPAGLFAAHAASMLGHEIIIMSKDGRKSFMRGAQYLHSPIPGLSQSDPFLVSYQLVGTAEGYRDKVYGLGSRVRVSPETLVGDHAAWDIREAYDFAWDLYGDIVMPLHLDGVSNEIDGLKTWCKPDRIISTVPAPLLCDNSDHIFASQIVWATDKVYGLSNFDNIVLCSGDPGHPWYRKSVIQGWQNTEYPDRNKPPVNQIWRVEKPIRTTCTCHPDVLRVGRYGLWEKGVLADGAFSSVVETLGKQDA